jgi:ABC-type Mn2+/Zn2+ transport system permease subunit
MQIPLFQRAMIAAAVTGATLPLLGVVIATLNLTVIRFALMHAGLLGAAIGLGLGIPPLTGALVTIGISSLLLGPWSDRMKVDTGLTGAFFMTGTMAVAFLLFYKAGVPAMEAFALFTGSLLTVTSREVWFVAALGIVVTACFTLFYREVQLVLYNQELAESLGVPVGIIRNSLLLLTGLAIGLAIRVVGALLIDGLILLPGLSALSLARDLRSALLLSSLFGIWSAMGGFIISLFFDVPTGPTITLVGVVLLAVITVAKGRFDG